jgi:enamine deaminase RidA (YjgF/YER057c/UK114 family)
MDAVLQRNGMEFSNVIRTWFYNDNILDWYDGFNKVRNDFFLKKRIFETLLPASTGVGGRNAAGTALAGGLLAVVPLDKAVRAAAVPSPLQDSATEYGSSFSRAVELALPDHSRLYVSGTASIDPTGRTAHAGDPEAQVKLTMEVVYTILKSRGMGWDNAKRALAYFKHAKDAPIFQKYCTQNNLRQFPAVIVENDICRDELLFEIEVDAIRTK